MIICTVVVLMISCSIPWTYKKDWNNRTQFM